MRVYGYRHGYEGVWLEQSTTESRELATLTMKWSLRQCGWGRRWVGDLAIGSVLTG